MFNSFLKRIHGRMYILKNPVILFPPLKPTNSKNSTIPEFFPPVTTTIKPAINLQKCLCIDEAKPKKLQTLLINCTKELLLLESVIINDLIILLTKDTNPGK